MTLYPTTGITKTDSIHPGRCCRGIDCCHLLISLDSCADCSSKCKGKFSYHTPRERVMGPSAGMGLPYCSAHFRRPSQLHQRRERPKRLITSRELLGLSRWSLLRLWPTSKKAQGRNFSEPKWERSVAYRTHRNRVIGWAIARWSDRSQTNFTELFQGATSYRLQKSLHLQERK